MLQSTRAVTHCPTSEQLQQFQSEWTKLDRLARWLIWTRLHWRDSIHDIDEAIGEAVAHAWREFVRIRLRRPNKPTKSAVRWAAKFGAGRVVSRIKFVPKPNPGYVDALDRRSPYALRCDELAPQTGLYVATCDTTDRTLVEAIIGRLPDHVQALARLLSYGSGKSSACERRGLSRRHADRLIGDLRKSLAEILRAVSSL